MRERERERERGTERESIQEKAYISVNEIYKIIETDLYENIFFGLSV